MFALFLYVWFMLLCHLMAFVNFIGVHCYFRAYTLLFSCTVLLCRHYWFHYSSPCCHCHCCHFNCFSFCSQLKLLQKLCTTLQPVWFFNTPPFIISICPHNVSSSYMYTFLFLSDLSCIFREKNFHQRKKKKCDSNNVQYSSRQDNGRKGSSLD